MSYISALDFLTAIQEKVLEKDDTLIDLEDFIGIIGVTVQSKIDENDVSYLTE